VPVAADELPRRSPNLGPGERTRCCERAEEQVRAPGDGERSAEGDRLVEVAELEAVSRSWRGGQVERGFAMSLDELRRDDHGDSLVVVGRDGDGRIRGFLHFAPAYGRAAVSLSAMRREHDTPNGLTEFLVARGLEQLRARGVREASLNFAAFARFVHAPRNAIERIVGQVLLVADAFFQIERLHRFNAKFFPRWEPRYLMYERALCLPRVGLAALWVEGQLPKPWPR